MLRLRHTLSAGLALAVSVALVGCGSTTSGPEAGASEPVEMRPLTLATTITGANFLAVSAAIEQGYFEEHGIDLEVITVKSSAEASAAAVSGQADAASILSENAIAVVANGGDLKLIGALLKDLQFSLVTAPDIADLAQLKGRNVSTQEVGGSEYIVRYALEDAGIDDDSVNFIALGAQSAQLAALQSEQVDAAPLVPPYDVQGEASGLNRILRFADLLPDVPTASLAASTSALEADPQKFKDFLAAVIEGANWVVDNPDEATQLLSEVNEMPIDEAKLAFDETLPLYSTTGEIAESGMQTWSDLGQKYGNSEPVDDITTTFDNSYLPGSN